MPGPSTRGMIKVGPDILKSTLDPKTGKILLQLGDVHRETVDADGVEQWQPYGFLSRPPKPDTGEKKAAQAVVLQAADRDIAIGTQDIRGMKLGGQVGEGEALIYASGPDGEGQARAICKATGAAALYSKKGNAEDGTGIMIAVNPDGSATMQASEGNCVLAKADGSIEIFNANGSFTVGADGKVVIAGSSQVAISAGSIALGGPAGLAIALGPNVVTAITALQAQNTALQSEITALQGEVSALVTAIAAVAAALVAVTNIPGPILPGHAAAAAPAPIAAAAAAVVVGVGAATIGASTATVAAQTAAQAAASAIIPSLRTTSD